MRNILVTAISGDIGNGILSCLKGTDSNLFGCDIYNYPAGLDKVQDFMKICPAKDDSYMTELINFCKKNQITHLIPANEDEIKKIALNRRIFAELGIKLIIQDDFALNTFFDKASANKFLSSLDGINVPKTWEFTNFPAKEGLYIVKPKALCGSKFVQEVRSKNEVKIPTGMNVDSLIVQEYIESPESEYTVGLFSDGKTALSVIFRQRLSNGYTYFVELSHDESIKKDALKIAEAINLKGYINVQLRKNGGKNYIFEINPRISGSVVFRHLVGFDDVLWWLDLSDGITPAGITKGGGGLYTKRQSGSANFTKNCYLLNDEKFESLRRSA